MTKIVELRPILGQVEKQQESVATKIENLLNVYEISKQDLTLIAELGEQVIPALDDYVDSFYAWLEPQPEFTHFFSDQDRLKRVKAAQRNYWH